jgi:hypothetical protein
MLLAEDEHFQLKILMLQKYGIAARQKQNNPDMQEKINFS